jgi:hypothetical protein
MFSPPMHTLMKNNEHPKYTSTLLLMQDSLSWMMKATLENTFLLPTMEANYSLTKPPPMWNDMN